MPVVDVKNLEGKKVGTIELADDVFAAKVNQNLLHEAVRHYLAGERAGTHKTKDKSEVSGAGKKLWKQKGTGRARIGSIRSPLWRHGGTVHGPVPRSYDYALPKKMIVGALRSALSVEAGGRETDGRGRLGARVAQDQSVPPVALEARRRDANDFAGRRRRERESRAREPQSGRRDAGTAPASLDPYDLMRHDRLMLSREAAERLSRALSTVKADEAGASRALPRSSRS